MGEIVESLARDFPRSSYADVDPDIAAKICAQGDERRITGPARPDGWQRVSLEAI